MELGFIAQDVEPVFPHLEGESNGTKSLNYVGMIAPLVQAVQELKAENEGPAPREHRSVAPHGRNRGHGPPAADPLQPIAAKSEPAAAH